MTIGKKYYFDVSGPFPKFTHDIDSIGDTNTKIECSHRLCLDKGRLISEAYHFVGQPSFENQNPLLEDFIDSYFSFFKKLRMCFSFIRYPAMFNITWPEGDLDGFPVGDTKFLKLLEIPIVRKGKACAENRYFDLEYGPTIHLLRHQASYMHKTKGDYEELSKIVGAIKGLVEKRRALNGHFVGKLQEDYAGERLWAVRNRAFLEQDPEGVPFTYINGFSFVDLDWVLENTDFTRENLGDKIRKVEFFGEGVSLLEILHLRPLDNPWYKEEHMRPSPLFPSILFPEDEKDKNTPIIHLPK